VIATLFDADLVYSVDLGQSHADVLASPGWDVLSDMISVDGQLAVTAIDQYRKLNGTRPTKITESVQRGPHGTSGVEHVVDQNDRTAVHIDR
jgi:hypothetical protein